MECQCILRKEFPHIDEHDPVFEKANGCSHIETDEAWVFIDALVSPRNFDDFEIDLACDGCKKAIVTKWVENGQNYVSFTCSIKHDNYITAFIEEIIRVTVHELIHLASHAPEPQVIEATKQLAPRWVPCRLYKPGGRRR